MNPSSSAIPVFVTRKILDIGLDMLRQAGYDVTVSEYDRPLTKAELITALKAKPYQAILSLLTDTIDEEVFAAAPALKVVANYAIGFNNFDLAAAAKRGIVLTNTPGGGADRVAEHTWALILALSCRVVEGDSYVRAGTWNGWNPMIFHGTKLAGKTLGIVGTGRIGADVAHRASKGFGMNVVYYDIRRNEQLEKEYGATFYATVEEVLEVADVVSLHVPLTKETTHLIDARRLAMMKPTAFLINTARGPIVDEVALVEALKKGVIRGAGLDVFENEPSLAPGLAALPNVVVTPHIASATEEARRDMATMSAGNIIAVLSGKPALNPVAPPVPAPAK
jgi:D-3-phosphoglycerate dehydrogenase